MNKSQKNSDLTAEEIKKYLSGEAMTNAQHKVEKKLLNDAFAAEVIEGFEALKTDKVDEKTVKNDLKKRLEKRVQTTQKTRKTIPLWQSISVAASVLLVLGISFYYFTQKPDNQVITEKKETVFPSKPSDNTTAIAEKEDDLVMLEKPKTVRESKKEIPAKIVADQEVFAETTPPKSKEIEIAKAENKTETKAADTAPIIAKSEEEISVVAAPKSAPVITENAETLAEIVVADAHSRKKSAVPQVGIITELNAEPIPEIGWKKYDNYLINSLKATGSVSTLTFGEPLRFRLTVEPNGELSNVQIENNLSKEQTEKVAEAIEKGPKWLPATKKGKKVRKNILRELKLK